jgi:hypothetical protein
MNPGGLCRTKDSDLHGSGLQPRRHNQRCTAKATSSTSRHGGPAILALRFQLSAPGAPGWQHSS